MTSSAISIAHERAKNSRWGYSAEVPVPLEKIARKHGIKIELAHLDDDLSGMSFIKGGVAVIVLNARHHPNRRRFTLAHELGHHMLHADYLRKNVHVDKIVLNRDSNSADGTDLKEIQANAFAAELLMPESELSKYRIVDLNNDEFIKTLAKKLKVSVSALTYRLINLGKL